MAPKGNKKSRGKSGGDNVLLLVKSRGGYYAAGSAWKLPAGFSADLDSFKPKAGVPVTLSTRAFVMRVDEAMTTPMEWIAQNLIPKPRGPGPRRGRS